MKGERINAWKFNIDVISTGDRQRCRVGAIEARREDEDDDNAYKCETAARVVRNFARLSDVRDRIQR